MKNAMLIINYNDYETTIRLINNVKDYKTLDLIVVVDNNSTDDSYSYLNKIKEKNIIIIKSDSNKGYSGAINIGCDYILEKYDKCNIAISNSDIKIDKEKDLKDLFSCVDDANVVVGPTIIQNNSKSRGWKLPTIKDDIFLNLPNHRTYEKKHLLYPEDYYNDTVSKVDTVSGSFFIINSDFYKEMNKFDENVFLYYEENILGKKIKDLKKQCIVVNKINVIHDHSVSIDKSYNKIKKYDMLKKSQYYYEKKYNKANIIMLGILKMTIIITRILLMIKYGFE